MKQGLVISGGGSKGAFAVGVVKDLMHLYQLDFDVLVGTSTGALIVPLVAVGAVEQLEQLYTTVSDEQILVKYNIGTRLNTSSIFTAGPLTDKINALYTDDYFQQLMASGKEVFLTTTCLQTEELVVFTTAQHPVENSYYKVRRIVSADQFRRAVLASASQPVFMPPVKVNKTVPDEPYPDHQFVDGGVREYAGVGMAVDAGAQEIFTITHAAKHPAPGHEVLGNLFAVLEKTISIFITDVGDNDLYLPSQYNAGLRYIDQVKQKMKSMGVADELIHQYFSVADPGGSYQNKQPLKLHWLQPETDLGGGPGGLVFNPAEMKDMLVRGQLALQSYVANLQPGTVGWV